MMKKETSTPKALAIKVGGGQRAGETSAQASKRGWGRIGVAALALTANAVGIGAAMNAEPKKPTETGQYIIQPGETVWGIASKVETNQDGVAGNKDIRPTVDDIYKQATKDGDARVMPGDIVDLPVEADLDPSVPGIQLDKE